MIAGAAVAGGLVGCNREVTDKDIRLVSIAEVRQWQRITERGDRSPMLLVDPRGERLYNAGHITGAENLRLEMVDPDDDRDARIEKRDHIVVYGDNPGSAVARAMTKRLIAAGYGRGKVRHSAALLFDRDTRDRQTVAAPLIEPAGEQPNFTSAVARRDQPLGHRP
ncbi:MAG: rhodanese-like domain-containing protein, partial [Planctomycetota bacterium]